MTKVLIIDDDKSLLEILTISLQQQGFQVFTTTQGETGIALAKSELPDVILLDLILTDIPGLEVLNKIKGNEKTANIPIIVLTSYENSKVETEAEKLGISGYLLKYKIQMKDIGSYVNKLINKHEENVPVSTDR
jgi:DNA-binding response OmpR family regulator